MNSASQPFTLEAKVQRPSQCKTPTWQYLFTKATTSQRKLGLDMHGNLWTPKLWSSGCRYFFIKNQKLTRYWPLDWRGCFGKGLIWDARSSFGFWAWPLEASHYAQPKAPIPIFYWLFSPHFFGL
jgi:hypothetical protein